MRSSDDHGSERFLVTRDYIRGRESIPLEAHADAVETQLRRFAKLVPVGEKTRLFEVGPGSGWLLFHAARQGLWCRGLELNPELADFARRRAREGGVSIDIDIGDVQNHVLNEESYDIVVATSVLEHIPDHRRVLERVHAALRPGGLFYFNSTNKFALRSGEYPSLWLYGWLPYRARKRIRVARQGPGIVTSAGIDFHQFTHPGLRHTLREVGFSRILSIYELLDVEDMNHPTRPRVLAMRASKGLPLVRHLIETFARGTVFYCVK